MKPRFLAPWTGASDRSAIYHVVSHIADSEVLLGDEDKSQFVEYMRQYEEYAGVRVLTYCIMDNHFQILVEVPPSSENQLSEDALVERLSILYSEEYVDAARDLFKSLRKSKAKKSSVAYQRLRESYTKRMWDLGLFIKTIKQRCTSMYNRSHGRRGTMWGPRYTSIIVENGPAAHAMAAHIDQTAVRAGLVKDAQDYRWCGYGDAAAGGQLARNGIARVLSKMDRDVALDGWRGSQEISAATWRSTATQYSNVLSLDGVNETTQGTRKKQTTANKQTQRQMAKDGVLDLTEIATNKGLYSFGSVAIGSKPFVREVHASSTDPSHQKYQF